MLSSFSESCRYLYWNSSIPFPQTANLISFMASRLYNHLNSDRDYRFFSARTLFPITLISLVGMICYEFIKSIFESNLTVWRFDVGATVFGSLAAAFIAYYFWPGRQRVTSKTVHPELREKQTSQPTNAPPNDAYFRQLFELNPQPMWIYDLATHEFLAVNESAVRHYGYSHEEFARISLKDVCLPSEPGAAPATVKSISPGYHTPRVWKHRKKNGMLIDVEVSSRTIDFGGSRAGLGIMHDVTEIKRIERAIIQSEAELRTLFGAMDDIIQVFDINGKYLKIAPTNPQHRYKSPEKSPTELIGKTVHEIYPTAQADLMLRNIRLALEQKEVQSVEYELPLNSGSIWSEARISPMSNETVFWISRDITQRKKAEEKLNFQQELLRNVIDTNPSLIFIKNIKGVYILANKAHAEAYNTTVENLIGKIDADFNPNREECEFYLQKDRELIESHKDLFIAEERITDKNGNSRCLQTVKRPIMLPDSSESHVLGICTDITERKQIEEQLRESEERYRELFENATDIIYTIDLNGQFTSLSKVGERLTGYSQEEIPLMNFTQIVAPEYLETVRQNMMKKVTGETIAAVYELEILAKDGRRIPLETSTRIIKVDGQPTGIQGISRDITERKKFEERLRESEKKFHDILGSMSEVVWSVSMRDLTVNYVSPAVETVYGRPAAEFWQDSELWQKVVYPEDAAVAQNFIQELRRDGGAQSEYRIIRPDGEVRWVNSRARVFNDLEGAPFRIDGITIDITERKQLEEQLRQAQKLESVGQLAAGIAHEINTPLQYVGDNTLFLKDSFRDLNSALEKHDELLKACRAGTVDAALLAEVEKTRHAGDIEYLVEEIPNALGQAIEGIERVTRIVQSMKDFAHPGLTEMKAVNLNKSIESTIIVTRNEWKYVAEMETDFDESLPPVVCMIGEINQVVLNLIINAVHTISDVVGDGGGDKGKITIQTKCDGEWVKIRVSDTGKGIPENVREKIFNPFFTTKEAGRGTGQGLAISHRVISKHRGNLSFESEVGSGTTFTIMLPVNGIQADVRAAESV